MTPNEKLKILSAYLPYKLGIETLDYKIDYVGKQFDTMVGLHQWDSLGKYWSCLTAGGSKPEISRVKPILRPLSELQNFANEYAMEFGGGVTYENRIDFAKAQLENIQYSAYPAISYAHIQFCLKRHINIFNLPESEYVKKE